jgi:thiol-disulfide isomerase/thioredoxin
VKPPRRTFPARAPLGAVATAALAIAMAPGCRSKPPASSKSTAAAARFAGLTFIADDYPAALQQAKQRNLPLFVDAWAPWCHTCLSMRQYVFTDPALAPWADRFVWLAIDTEKDGSAAFLAKHPVDAWPTLFVIDPATGTARAMWRGALKVDELVAWLAEATGTAAPAGSRERAAEARLGDLRRRKDDSTCVAEAQAALRWMMPGTSRLNVAIEGLTCAQRLPAGAPTRSADAAALAAAIEAMVQDPGFALLPDDRSNGYSTLVEAAQGAHDDQRARQLAGRWLAELDKAAAAAPSPAARAVFDSHRVEAALALGRPEAAIPALQASARDFPGDYNPPARLARLYLTAGRIDLARAEIDRALGLVYGPRRRRLEQLQTEIKAAEKAAAGAPRDRVKTF